MAKFKRVKTVSRGAFVLLSLPSSSRCLLFCLEKESKTRVCQVTLNSDTHSVCYVSPRYSLFKELIDRREGDRVPPVRSSNPLCQILSASLIKAIYVIES